MAVIKILARLSGITVVTAVISGCATWSDHAVAAGPSQRLRIAVLPVQSAVEIEHLNDLMTPSQPTTPEDEPTRVRERLAQVTANMTRDIETRVAASPCFEVVTHEELREAMGTLYAPLTAEQVKSLGRTLDVRAVLVIQLSGYGQLKKRWIAYFVGTGVAEGTVEGVVVWRALDSPWLGLVVGGEEIVQEILTWGGGAYLFNKRYSPVILEGALIGTGDGETVWSDTGYSSIDTRALALLPKEEQEKREVQLKLTGEAAEQDLLDDLETTASKMLRRASCTPVKDALSVP